jgi:hypothetical protein
MAKKRQYNVKGTNDFLVLSIIFAFLCIWSIRDAWFPTKGVLKRHPLQFEIVSPVDGVIHEIHAPVGTKIVTPKDRRTPSLVFELNSSALSRQFEAEKARYAELKASGSDEAENSLVEINRLKEEIDALKIYCPLIGTEKDGKVIEVLVDKYGQVSAGDPVLRVLPNEQFYIFNKSLAIVSFVLFLVFLGLHIFGR